MSRLEILSDFFPEIVIIEIFFEGIEEFIFIGEVPEFFELLQAGFGIGEDIEFVWHDITS